MKIGIDATVLARTNKTGVDYFTLGLIEQLAKQLPQDEIDLCYFGSLDLSLGVNGSNVIPHPITVIPRKVYQGLFRYLIPPPYDLLARTNPDVFFFPDYIRLPLWHHTPSLTLIHDLSYLDTPQFLKKRHRDYLTRFVPHSIKRSTHLIANSEFTKQRIVEHYHYNSPDITVIYPGIDPKLFRPATKAEIRPVLQRFGIEREYILFTGTLTDRKNVTGLMRAYMQLAPKVRQHYQLVLAGGHLQANVIDPDIDALYSQIATRGDVIKTGYIQDQQDLIALYSGATAFVYPAFYEGFGMPILEAMSCGVPVITSHTSSMPEVGGDAALYVDPTDPHTITSQLERVLTSQPERERLIQLGNKNIKRFSWEASGWQLAELLKAQVKH